MQSQAETQWEGARDPEGFRKTHWETMSAEEVLGSLGTTAEGLSKEDSEDRLTGWGPNELPEEKERGSVVRFLLQFHNALIYVLLAATVLTAVMQHWLDT